MFTDPYKAISPGACIVIETVDIQSFMNSLTTGKGLFGEAGKVREFEKFNMKLKFLADQLNNDGFKKILTNKKVIISFHTTKEGKLKPLLSMTVPGEIRNRQVKEILRSSGIKNIFESKSTGYSVIKIPFTDNNLKDTAYISLISGLMVCSSSRELLEEACTQTGKGTDVRDLPGFSRVLLASGKKEDKIFVIFANLPQLLKSVLGSERKGLTEKIARLAGTAEGDIYINEDGLVLSGYIESTDSSDFFYKYKSVAPQPFHTYKVLPSSTIFFETIIYPEEGRCKRIGATLSKDAVNLALKINEYTGQEITRAYIDIKDRPVGDNTLIIYELTNRVQTEQLFLEELGKGNEIIYFKPDDQIKIPVYRTHFKGLIDVMLPGFAPDFDDSYFSFYDNFMITGNSFETISRFLYNNLLNKTLANDLTYRDFENTLPSQCRIFFLLCSIAYYQIILPGFLMRIS